MAHGKKQACWSLSRVWLFVAPWTVSCQTPLSMGFSRQEHWSGQPFSSPGDLPNSRIEPGSPTLQAYSFLSEPPGKPLAHCKYPVSIYDYCEKMIHLNSRFLSQLDFSLLSVAYVLPVGFVNADSYLIWCRFLCLLMPPWLKMPIFAYMLSEVARVWLGKKKWLDSWETSYLPQPPPAITHTATGARLHQSCL